MKVLENKRLSSYTTFRMGGIAKKIYVPQNIEELIKIEKENKNIMNYMIGGGSNLLVNDEKAFDEVLLLREFNNVIENKENGIFYIGASVKLQQLIQKINLEGYGGIEYLYSVPGLVGGAIYMNAGRGKVHNSSISDYLIKVEYLEDGKLKYLEKKDCKFEYRSSIFQQKDKIIITGAYFQFKKMDNKESQSKINERLELCKKVQDMSAPNFGTVFCQSNKLIMALVKKLKIGYKDGVHFSSKTTNWLLNGKNGSFLEAIKLINKVKKIHKFFRKECKVEVKIWK